jgi:hypothetical protein
LLIDWMVQKLGAKRLKLRPPLENAGSHPADKLPHSSPTAAVSKTPKNVVTGDQLGTGSWQPFLHQ